MRGTSPFGPRIYGPSRTWWVSAAQWEAATTTAKEHLANCATCRDPNGPKGTILRRPCEREEAAPRP